MQKNFIDLKLLKFSEYLNDIGILSQLKKEQFENYFYKTYSKIHNNEDIPSSEIDTNFIYIEKCLISALVNYISSLSEDDQKILALNIYEKYNQRETKIEDKLIKILNIYSKNKLRSCFKKWKSDLFILTNSLKKVISSNILSNIQNSIDNKYIKENNLSKENKINTNNNNSMLNINSHLNISTKQEIFNNDNNYSFHENNFENNINYTYENKNRRKNNGDSNKIHSLHYFNPSNNNINCNYHNESYNYIQSYLNKINTSNIKPLLSKERYSANNSALLNNSDNNYTNNWTSLKPKKTKVNFDYINNLSKSKTEHNLVIEKTTKYLKEQEELNNFCTFKPKINKSSSFSRYWNSSNKRSSDRLYLDSKSRLARKELESLKKNNLESKENTFQPKFISSSVKRVKSDFDKRLKEFEIIKKNKIKKLSEDLEEEKKQQFTFTPKINEFTYYNNSIINNKRNFNMNNNYTISNISKTSTINQSVISKNNNSKKIPVYKRLYNENKNKLIRQEQREKEEMEKIKKNSSKFSEGSNGVNNNLLDRKKIEELYNDYKTKKTRLKLKQEEIEKEQGITFQPELISDKNYFERINPDFYMREKIFLERQQKNIETYKQYLENEKIKKRYSHEEKKEIFNNIVNRLYKDGMEKYKEKTGKTNVNIDRDNIFENNESLE